MGKLVSLYSVSFFYRSTLPNNLLEYCEALWPQALYPMELNNRENGLQKDLQVVGFEEIEEHLLDDISRLQKTHLGERRLDQIYVL